MPHVEEWMRNAMIEMHKIAECELAEGETECHHPECMSALNQGAEIIASEYEKAHRREVIDNLARAEKDEGLYDRMPEAHAPATPEIERIKFVSGKFRSELRSACPSVKSNDAEWIIGYFVTEIENAIKSGTGVNREYLNQWCSKPGCSARRWAHGSSIDIDHDFVEPAPATPAYKLPSVESNSITVSSQPCYVEGLKTIHRGGCGLCRLAWVAEAAPTTPKTCPTCGSDDPKKYVATSLSVLYRCENPNFHENAKYDPWHGAGQGSFSREAGTHK